MSIYDLPAEIIDDIARSGRSVYRALVFAFPPFSRSITFGRKVDFIANLGYDVKVSLENASIRRYLNGRLHSTDAPAIEWFNEKEWYYKGRLHRIGGPAIESAGGTKKWYHKGRLHRIDGPAIEHANGDKEWYRKGKLHRIGGPAIERADGSNEWHIRGREVAP